MKNISEVSANFINLTMQSLSMILAPNFPLSPRVSTYDLFDLTRTRAYLQILIANLPVFQPSCRRCGRFTALHRRWFRYGDIDDLQNRGPKPRAQQGAAEVLQVVTQPCWQRSSHFASSESQRITDFKLYR